MNNRHISTQVHLSFEYNCLFRGGGEVQSFFVLHLKETKRKIVDHSKQFVAICLFETFSCPQTLRDLCRISGIQFQVCKVFATCNFWNPYMYGILLICFDKPWPSNYLMIIKMEYYSIWHLMKHYGKNNTGFPNSDFVV